MTQDDTLTTPYGALVIRAARPDDLETLLEIDASAYGWRASRGFPAGPPPRPLRDIFTDAIARHEMYIALHEGVPAGKIVLQWSDDLWHDLPVEAGYVHGFAVHRAFAGKEIGRAMLRWAEQETLARGKRLLRLDCNADNPALRRYYEDAGFTHRGDMTLPHRTASRYEKSLTKEEV